MAVLLCHRVPGLLLHSTRYNSILIKKIIKSGIFAQMRHCTQRESKWGEDLGATHVIVPDHSWHCPVLLCTLVLGVGQSQFRVTAISLT